MRSVLLSSIFVLVEDIKVQLQFSLTPGEGLCHMKLAKLVEVLLVLVVATYFFPFTDSSVLLCDCKCFPKFFNFGKVDCWQLPFLFEEQFLDKWVVLNGSLPVY